MAVIERTGGRPLRRALRDSGADMKQLTKIHKAIADFVAVDAARRAPNVSGDLAASLKGSGTRTKARVTSRLPYAGVQEWGWPDRGIEPKEFVMEAARANASDMLEYIVAETAKIGRRAGFDVRSH